MLTLFLIPSLSVQAKVKWIYNWVFNSVRGQGRCFFYIFLLRTREEKIYAWYQLID
jgi:hypothetical protein